MKLPRKAHGSIDWWGTFVYVAVLAAIIFAVNDITGVVRTPAERRIERRITEKVILLPQVRFPRSHVVFRVVGPSAPRVRGAGRSPAGRATPRRGGTPTTQRSRKHAKKKKAKKPAAIFRPLAPVAVPSAVPAHGKQPAPGQAKPKPQKRNAAPKSDEPQRHEGPKEPKAHEDQKPSAKDAKIVAPEQPTSPSSPTQQDGHPGKQGKDDARPHPDKP